MAMRETRRRWLRRLGYTAFFFLCFFFFLYQTFPYRRLVESLTVPLQRQARVKFEMESLSPYFVTGVDVGGLNVQMAARRGIAEVEVARLQTRLSILPLLWGSQRVGLQAELAQGDLRGTLRHRRGQIDVEAEIKGLNLGALGPPPSKIASQAKNPDPPKPLFEQLFAPVYGTLDAQIETSLHQRLFLPQRGPSSTPPPLEGRIKASIKSFSLGPGEFSHPQMGEIPIPRLRLGTFQLEIVADKGVARILKAEMKGGADAEMILTGSIELKQPLFYSIFRGELRFRLTPEFTSSPSLPTILRTALGLLGTPKMDGFHYYRVYAPFYGNPRLDKM